MTDAPPPQPRFGERFEKALAYTFQAHGQQTRKGTDTPYMGHLLGVASLVIEDGGDEDQVIAALLHDAVEDQGGWAACKWGPRTCQPFGFLPAMKPEEKYKRCHGRTRRF